MNASSEYSPAQLSPDLLLQLRQFEEHCRQSTGEEIILIAYAHRPQPGSHPIASAAE